MQCSYVLKKKSISSFGALSVVCTSFLFLWHSLRLIKVIWMQALTTRFWQSLHIQEEVTSSYHACDHHGITNKQTHRKHSSVQFTLLCYTHTPVRDNKWRLPSAENCCCWHQYCQPSWSQDLEQWNPWWTDNTFHSIFILTVVCHHHINTVIRISMHPGHHGMLYTLFSVIVKITVNHRSDNR